MESRERLRNIVASVFEVELETIGPEFPLQSKRVRGSIGRGILTAAIRKQLDPNFPNAFRFRTFRALEQALAAEVRGADDGGRQEHLTPAPATPASSQPTGPSCGLDIETVTNLPACEVYEEHAFYTTNFTALEIAYCSQQDQPRIHFAARWCAKEALRKCGPGWIDLAMDKIQVAEDETGRPRLELMTPQGPSSLSHAVSLSHTDRVAAAVVVGPVSP